ncbi:MAG: G/U mismatch-specific DNA glycosylase [Chloroflexi bacterium]|nr:G/U mismatch-specific DNA glycosylase [Chloroflexota bacterium]
MSEVVRIVKPSRAEIAAAAGKTVPDLVGPGLRVLFVGINPSLYSGAVGHHFARPGNRFWPVLHQASFTPRQLSPFEERELLEVGVGVTNIVQRATASADQLSASELREGAERLAEKVRRFGPAYVAVVGVSAYRTGFGQPKARIGLQPEVVGGANVWVLPNPSGLQAHYQLPELVRLYGELRHAAFGSAALRKDELAAEA